MPRLRILLFATALVIAMTALMSSTRAQGPGGPPGGPGGPGGGRGGFGGRGGGGGTSGAVGLLDVEEVQTELNMSEKQVFLIPSVVADVQKKSRAERQALRDSTNGADPDPETLAASNMEIQKKGEAAAAKMLGLSADQKRRLSELYLQRQVKNQGYATAILTVPDLPTKLNLSDDQISSLKALQSTVQAGQQQARDAGRAIFDEIRQSLAAQAQAAGGTNAAGNAPGGGGGGGGGRGGFGGFDRAAFQARMDSPEVQAKRAQVTEQGDMVMANEKKQVATILSKKQRGALDAMMGKPYADIAKLGGRGFGGFGGGPPGGGPPPAAPGTAKADGTTAAADASKTTGAAAASSTATTGTRKGVNKRGAPARSKAATTPAP